MTEPTSEAPEADVQEQQQTAEGDTPDLDRLERDLGDGGESGDVEERSQD